MDKDFDLDLALAVVDISGVDTAEPPPPPPPGCFTPSDDHHKSFQVDELASVDCEIGLCIVCMEGFERCGVDNDHGKKMPCGHVFHANCLTKWLSMRNSCPLCRYKVSVD